MSSALRIPSTAQPWPGTVVAALLVTLEHPAGWALALAGFLARGGLVLFLLPIVVLPTPAGLQTTISPLIVPFHFGELAPGFVALVVGLVALGAAWIVAGGLVGAWSEAFLVREAATEHAQGVDPWGTGRGPRRRGAVLRVLATRLLAHIPLAIALAWGAARIVDAVYAQVTVPFEVVTPLAIRIVAAVPDAITVVSVAWLLGEAAGGLAAREVAIGGRGVWPAAIRGWLGLLRRPLASVATVALTTMVVLVALVPGLLAVGAAWTWVRAVLYARAEPLDHVAALGTLVALWLVTLALTGFAAAFRSNCWTAEWLRRRSVHRAPPESTPEVGWPVGTIGDAEATRPGG